MENQDVDSRAPEINLQYLNGKLRNQALIIENLDTQLEEKETSVFQKDRLPEDLQDAINEKIHDMSFDSIPTAAIELYPLEAQLILKAKGSSSSDLSQVGSMSISGLKNAFGEVENELNCGIGFEPC